MSTYCTGNAYYTYYFDMYYTYRPAHGTSLTYFSPKRAGVEVCQNFDVNSNGTYLGYFQCPLLPNEPSSFTSCCGSSNAQYCCCSTTYNTAGTSAAVGISAGFQALIAILVILKLSIWMLVGWRIYNRQRLRRQLAAQNAIRNQQICAAVVTVNQQQQDGMRPPPPYAAVNGQYPMGPQIPPYPNGPPLAPYPNGQPMAPYPNGPPLAPYPNGQPMAPYTNGQPPYGQPLMAAYPMPPTYAASTAMPGLHKSHPTDTLQSSSDTWQAGSRQHSESGQLQHSADDTSMSSISLSQPATEPDKLPAPSD